MARFSRTASATDDELMRRVQADDADAFEQLYDRHLAHATCIVRSVLPDAVDAEDAIHDGFLSVWRERAGYRPQTASFQQWSMAIIRRSAIDAERRRDGDALGASLALLPDAQAEIIALAFYGDMTHTQIAEQLALSDETVKGRIRLGLQNLSGQAQGTG